MEEYTPLKKISLENKKYHVFLSFRGEDTRQNLVEHLYQSLSAAGVHVFLDSKKIKGGDKISERLKQAIEKTDIHIPIFSPNYAESAWCLKEVTQISKSKGLVIPLFYGVEPADVRYPDQRKYAVAFSYHSSKGRHKPETIDEWKKALEKVSSLSGWCLQTTSGYEGKLVKRVVSDVLNTLNNVPLDVTKCAVGLKDRMDAVIDLLRIGVNDRAVTVGIWGSGGIGKSTLAKAVYNDIFRQFEAVSFVSDVRANAWRVDGMRKLQRQILQDLLKSKVSVNNVDHGKALMRERLQSIRALVVLDDVDHKKQIEALGPQWLAAGSRVIVTSRDKRLFDNEILVYPLHELKQDEALQLFSWHAFLKPRPDKDFKDLSQRIVDACGGLPLSVEVVGASLYQKKDESRWKETLGQLQSALIEDINGRLKISYEDLNSQEREIFLDIACFLEGQDKEAAISFWEDLNLNPHIHLSNLVLKSLVKIINNKQEEIIRMHDPLRAMGRAIVNAESRVPSRRSRVWNSNEGYAALHTPWLGYETVRSVSISSSDLEESLFPDYLDVNRWESTKRLQLIWLDKIDILRKMKLGPFSSDLRWFKWISCPLHRLPLEWMMERLVVLDLSGTTHFPSLIQDIWIENSTSFIHKKPKNLKFLLLSRCVNLERLPDLSQFTSLIRLDLKDCLRIKKIPESIGLLVHLKRLSLSGCKNIYELPDSIGNLSSLEILFMKGCLSIRKLPATFERLEGLREADLGCLEQIEKLPPFGTDWCLNKLILSGCCRLSCLPASIGHLRRLTYLEMNECRNIFHLPEEFGDLESLSELFLNECPSLQDLPQSFGNLKNLKSLEVKKDTSLFKLPESFSRLRLIQRINATGSYLVGGFPLPELSTLQILELENTFIGNLPFGLSRLEKLTTLVLNKCNKLWELPPLPQTLVRVEARDCKQIKTILNLVDLKNLQVLDLRNCQRLEELPGLSSLESLKKLDIRGCTLIKNLAGLGLGRLKSLQTLYLSGPDLIGLNVRQIVQVDYQRGAQNKGLVRGLVFSQFSS